jgi:hypothetical protein
MITDYFEYLTLNGGKASLKRRTAAKQDSSLGMAVYAIYG